MINSIDSIDGVLKRVSGLGQYYFVISRVFMKTAKADPLTRHPTSCLYPKILIPKMSQMYMNHSHTKTPPRFIHVLDASLRQGYGHSSPGNRANSQKRMRTRAWLLSVCYCVTPSAICLRRKNDRVVQQFSVV